MLKIRLRRMGAKKDAFYRVIVSDSRKTPSGRFVDVLGTHDPRVNPAITQIDVAKADEWIRKGAHPSPTVKSLISHARQASS